MRTIYKIKTPSGIRTVDAEQSALPLLPKERHLNFVSIFMVQAAGSIATWAFVSGSSIGALVPAKFGICATFFGVVAALAYHLINSITFTRWGLDQSIVGAATFGTRGIRWLLCALAIPVTWCWSCLPAIMLGHSVENIINAIGITGPAASWKLWGVITFIVGLLLGIQGSSLIDRLYRVATPVMLVLIFLVTMVLFKTYGISECLNIAPKGFKGNEADSYMTAVEIAVGVGFSWVFYLAGFSKAATSEIACYGGNFGGLGIAWALCMIPAIICSSVTGVSDPVEALAGIAGPWTVMWMIMLILANMSSIVVNPYWISCSLTSMFPNLEFKKAMMINMCVIPLIIFPVTYEKFGVFANIIGALLGPTGCVWTTDVLLRKCMFDLRQLYSKEKGNRYWYYGGFNVWAFVCIAVGTVVSLSIYDPVSQVIRIRAVFSILGAAIPGSLVATGAYVVCYFMFVKKNARK